MTRILPQTSDLLNPHGNDLEYKLRPGMVTLTWTSMNIDAYKHHFQNGLQKLEELVIVRFSWFFCGDHCPIKIFFIITKLFIIFSSSKIFFFLFFFPFSFFSSSHHTPTTPKHRI